jgi:hypothetical protein
VARRRCVGLSSASTLLSMPKRRCPDHIQDAVHREEHHAHERDCVAER